MSEKSDEEKGCGSSEKLGSLVEKASDSINFTSGTEMEDSGSESNWRKERPFVERKSNFGSGRLKKEILAGEDSSVSEEFKDTRLERSIEDREYRSVDSYSQLPEREMDHWTRRANQYTEIKRPDSVTSSIGEISTQMNKFMGSVRSRPRMDWPGVERDRFEGLYGSNSSVVEQARTPTFSYPDEGPSNYDPYSFHDHVHVNVPGGVEKLERERAELLRKLDELKDQLSRSYHLVDKPKEREPMDRTLPHPYRNQVTYNVAVQPPAAMEKPIPRPSYLDYSHGPVSYANHHDMDTRSFYSPHKQNLNEIPEYDDPFQVQRARKPPLRPPHQDQHMPPHDYYMGKHRDIDLDHFAQYLHENFFHAPACSCLICYNQNRQLPPRVPPTNGAQVNLNSNFYHYDNDRVMLERQNYPPPQFLDAQRHARWPSDLDSEIDGYGDPRRMVATSKIRRHYRPIAGGAPFITCHKCFELLKLPRKNVRLTNHNKIRLRCGACSAVILLKIENNKLVTSDITELANISAGDDQSSPEVLNVSLVSSGSLNANYTSSCSEDFKKSSYNFQSAVTEHKSLVEENERSYLYKSEKRKGYSSSPSASSKEEESIPRAIARDDFSESAEFPLNNASSTVPPRSPMWQESDSPRHAISRYGQGNNSKHWENDDTLVSRISCQEDPVRTAAEATELDVSFNEYQNNTSQEFAEMSEEDYQLKFSKGSDSFLVGFIKKSFRDFSRPAHSEETERPKVFINGHPLLDRVVKRAEKHAGPIRPGDYW